MDAIEESDAGKPKSFVIRMFGIFAFLFGLPYLIQGVTMLVLVFPRGGRLDSIRFQLLVSTIALDLVLGLAPPFIGVGLFLYKEWARKSWLAYLLLTLFVHLHMTVLQFLVRRTHMVALYKWIAVVVFVSILSWAYLSRASTKAYFH
jgi:hypothetical protein